MFSICALYDNVRSSVTPRYTGMLQWVKFHPVPADVELFAAFTIPQVEETDLRHCRIRAELVCGTILQQTVSSTLSAAIWGSSGGNLVKSC